MAAALALVELPGVARRAGFLNPFLSMRKRKALAQNFRSIVGVDWPGGQGIRDDNRRSPIERRRIVKLVASMLGSAVLGAVLGFTVGSLGHL
jgi:hypothetical protein